MPQIPKTGVLKIVVNTNKQGLVTLLGTSSDPKNYHLGDTVLHLCLTFNQKDPVRPLLRAGVKLKEGNKNQNTILHLAAEKSKVEYFKRIANYHITDRGDKVEALSEFLVDHQKLCISNQNLHM